MAKYELGITLLFDAAGKEPTGTDSEDEHAGHLRVVSRALFADKARMGDYLLYRWAWDLIQDDPAITLCEELGVPGESEGMVKHLLGLHLPPATRRYMQAAAAGGWSYDFLENLDEIIAVRQDCANCGATH